MKIDEINLTDILTLIINEAIKKSSLFNNCNINQILIAGSKNKSKVQKTTFSKVVPLRFKNGNNIVKYKNEEYFIPKMSLSGYEILYIIYFYLPNFFNLSPKMKVEVIFHELYHISPEFDGDIRRVAEQKYAHGSSSLNYSKNYKKESEIFYSYIMKTKYSYFLRMKYKDIQDNFKKIKLRKIKKPKAFKLTKTCNLHE